MVADQVSPVYNSLVLIPMPSYPFESDYVNLITSRTSDSSTNFRPEIYLIPFELPLRVTVYQAADIV